MADSDEWFGPFHLLRSLGVGPFGEVFFARTPRRTNARCAAVKRLHAKHAASPVFVSRFQRSMRLARAIVHPNIVPLFDSGSIHGVLYTSAQPVPGLSIEVVAERLTRRKLGAPAAIGVRVLLDILSALARVEDLLPHGGVERNVLIGWDGIARLSDLGLPRDDEKSDLAGLGIAVHRLFSGGGALEALSSRRPDLPQWIPEVIGELIFGPGQSPTEVSRRVMSSALRDGLAVQRSAVASWLWALFPSARLPGFVDRTRAPGTGLRPASRTEDEVFEHRA